MSLNERIAQALGWPLKDVQSFSFQSLREVVRPVSPKLAHELTMSIQGEYIIDPVGLLRGTDDQDMDLGDV
jgi:hypothetical protein